jgi:hypothetical protein
VAAEHDAGVNVSALDMSAGASPCQWSAAETDSIELREWDDEYVVHVEAQATTHLLDAATGAVLKALLRARQAISIDELAGLSFGTADESAPAALSTDECAALQAILLELQRIGMAQVHPS